MRLILTFLLLFSCAPVISTRAKDKAVIITNQSGSFSCLNGSCCWPYRHHRDIQGYAIMVCTDEKIDSKQVKEGNLTLNEMDFNIRVIYDETAITR